MQETDCGWARVTGAWTRQTESADASGYHQNAETYRVGAQREIADGWFLGATAGLTQSALSDSDRLSRTNGVAGDVAVSLKHQIGPWLLAMSGHMGYGTFETQRLLDVGPSVWLANGTSDIWTAAARVRASYELAYSNWYIKPYTDLDLLYTAMPGYNEHGMGGMDLHFSSARQWNVAVSPSLEIGGRLDVDPQAWLRPYASVGMTFFARDSMDIGVTFGNAADAGFITQAKLPATLVNVTAGLQIFSTKGYELRTEYSAGFSRNYISQEASLRLAVPF
ncbi:autotransporter outer membrane beta-barrel domain-containing protein [Bradyrhizobium elkanii]|uniref:autotransporter outer membrane beta-barrel domain-containing protein n=1 Tax=Bradyrhizobium elkanii TaxID=29448 RepID=UPI001FDAA91D|nr:autotransporter outer membrane beta-barrel domain-containing protein [Bradyrhizobium elkanii]